MNPIQNSNPASANKKNEVEVNIRSSLIIPVIDVKLYNTTHITSEYNIITNKFLQFNKNIKDDTQNKNVQKLIQVNIKII
jgi:hypothetical protein